VRFSARLADPLYGAVACFGVVFGHRSDPLSRPAKNIWLDSITNGRGLEPTPPPKHAPKSPTTVQSNLARAFDGPSIRF